MTQGFDYLDLGGGVNRGADAADIPAREMAKLVNFYPYHGRLKRRGGSKLLSFSTSGTSPWDGQQITSIFALRRRQTGSGLAGWQTLVGGLNKFGKLENDALVEIPMILGLTPASSQLPWVTFQYKDYGYAIRRGGGGLIRLLDTASPAGIEEPATAPVITPSGPGTGSLPIGDYYAVVTFFNIETGMEGNPSDVSAVGTMGVGNQSFDWSSIPVSTNPFVTARRLYRTLENQTGTYFLVTQINDNTTTTYNDDDFAVDDLGPSVSFRHGMPPVNSDLAAVWQERAFLSDGQYVYPSEVLFVECFSGDAVPIGPDDGGRISALCPWNNRLVVGKTNKIYYLSGSPGSNNFAVDVLTEEHGCMSHHSMKTAEGSIFWYGSGKNVYRCDGGKPFSISTPRVQPYLDAIPDDREEYIVGAIYPRLSWYILTIPQVDGVGTGSELEDSENNRVVLIYNYKFDTWTVLQHYSDAPQFVGTFYGENYEQLLRATFYDGEVYTWNDETYNRDDASSDIFETAPHNIWAEVWTRKDEFGGAGYRKCMDQVWLKATTIDNEMDSLSLSLIGDGEVEVVGPRTVSLRDTNEWKPYKMQNWRNPQTSMQLKLVYTGLQPITLDGIHFEVATLNRRPKQPQ